MRKNLQLPMVSAEWHSREKMLTFSIKMWTLETVLKNTR